MNEISRRGGRMQNLLLLFFGKVLKKNLEKVVGEVGESLLLF